MQQITESDFEELVINASIPVLVKFAAKWCAPCRIVQPLLEEIQPNYDGTLQFYIHDIEDSSIPVKYQVQAVPCIIIFNNGDVVDKLVGAKFDAEGLKDFIENCLQLSQDRVKT